MTLSDWKHLAITEEFISELKRRVKEQTEALASSAGVDPRLDSFRAGVIAALNDVVDFHFENEESHGD